MKILPLWSEQVRAKNKQKRSVFTRAVVLLSFLIVVLSFQHTVAEEIRQRTIHTNEKDVKMGEELSIDMGLYTGKKMRVEVEDAAKNREVVNIAYDKQSKKIVLKDKPKPGKYKLYLYDDKDLIYKSDFSWGVLALNTDKSIYTLGDTVNFSFAVLDPKGDMVCDADLTLTIENKVSNEKTTLTTSKGIKVNDVCKQHAFTLTPDYEAVFKPTVAGTYSLDLKAVVNDESFEIKDIFIVEESPDFDISRETVTRVYPVEAYPVTINIKANKKFKGVIKETVPYDFDILEPDGSKMYDELVEGKDEKYLLWNVDLKKGQQLKIGYKFDAPNRSPDFFTLGKLKLIRSGNFLSLRDNEDIVIDEALETTQSTSSIEKPIDVTDSNSTTGADNLVLKKEVVEFEEIRFWQLANDSVGTAHGIRLYSTGFELNTATAGVEYDTNINTPSISSSVVHSGSYALNTALVSSGTEGINHAFAAANSSSQHYVRAYLRIATAPSADIKVIEVYSDTSASRVYVTMTTGRTLKLYDTSGTLIGSASSALSLNTWYRVEIMFDNATAGNAELALKIDGSEIASSTTATVSNSNNVSFGILENATADLYWDDIAINEDSDNFESDWPGEGNIVYLRPNGNGTDTGWANDYTYVDELTPNDATDYISCSSNADVEDYEYQNSSDVGISSSHSIKIVEGWIRTSAPSAGNARTHALALEYGGNQDIASTAVNSTSWYTDDDGIPRGSTVRIYNEPGSVSGFEPITPSMLDSISTELTTTDCTPNIRVTAIWLLVEYYSTEGGRAFSSGFELQSTTAGVEWTSVSGSPAIDTTTKNGGAASLRVASLSSGTEESLTYAFEATSTNTNGPLYFRSYLYITTAPGSANRIISVKNSSGTAIVYLTLDNSRLLRLYDEDGIVGSASSALSTSTWYRIEFKLDATGSGSTDVVEARINGSVFATSSTRNLSTGVRTLTVGANINSEANTTGDIYFDDIAINRNIGTYQNSYPGVGKIAHLRPDSGTAPVEWTGVYADVDEITPDDGTTRISTSTLYDTESMTLDNTSTPGITSGAHINLVSLGARFSSGATSAASALSLLDSTGYYIESEYINSSGTYETNNDTEPREYPLTMYTRPQINSLWTTAELDAAILRARYVDASGSTSYFISTLWVLVEYYDPINVSGTCDAFDQTTDCGDTGTLRVAVNGELLSVTQETVSGAWTISDVPQPSTGDIITVFIDGASDTDEAAAVAQYDGSGDITGVKLYKEHLVIGSVDNQNISNTDLSSYDNSVSGDEDIFFDVSSGNLTVDSTAQSTTERLYIDASDTYQPGGSVSTHDIEIDGTFTAEANALTISGSWNNDSNFSSTGTTTFTATSGTETIDSTGSSTNSFHNLTLGSGSGSATWNMSSALDINNDLTISYGTLAQNGSNNITLAGSMSIGASGNYTKSTGTFTFDGTTAETFTNTNSTITFDAASSSQIAPASTAYSWSHTVGSNNDRILVVGVGIRGNVAVSSVTYNGDSLTFAREEHPGSDVRTEIWYLLSPDTGSNTVTVTLASSQSSSAGAVSYYNVGGAISNAGDDDGGSADTSSSIVLASETGQLVVDAVSLQSGSNDLRVGLNQTQRVNYVGTHNTVGISDEVGTLSTNSTWQFTSNYWAGAAISLRPAATLDNLGTVVFNKTDTVSPSTNNKVTLASSMVTDNVTINGTGGQADTLDLGSSGYILELKNSGSTANVLTNSGTLTIGTSTIKFSATNSGGNININNLPYSSLQVSGGETYVLTGNQTSANAITGNLEIDYGATLDVTTAPYGITLEDNWLNIGTFTQRTGTVTIGGSGTTTLAGTTTFYNFSCTVPGKTIKFAYNYLDIPYFTFQNILTLEGTSGSEINLESTLATYKWLALFTIDQNTDSSPTSDLTIEYVNVKDSGCHSSNTKLVYNLALGGSVNQGNNDSCWQFNQSPNSPSSLAQAETDDTPIALGAWTSDDVKFSVSASDPDSSDTLYLCVEKDIVGTSFSNTEDSCGSGVAYSGSPVTLSAVISGLTTDQPYHWQARVKDAAGAYSSWVSYGANLESATDFGSDTTAPSGGTVYDGTSAGNDSSFNDGSLSSLSANWSGISSNASGLLRYDYSIGTTIGGTDIKTWTSNTTSTSVTATSLTLQTSKIYYFNVRTIDNAGNTSTYISSNGQAVAPTLAFSVSPSSVTFSNLNVGNSYQDTETTTLTTSTNAYSGYVIRAFISDLLTSPVNPSAEIVNFNGGSYASPDEFRSTDLGFGYTSSDTSVQGSNKFGVNPCSGGGTPPCYAPFALTGPGDIVADHTSNVTGSPITNEQFTITYKVKVPATQEALPYSTTVIYTITPIY